MRVMVIVKAIEDSEAGVMPSEQLLTEMGQFNEELVKAGVMLAGEGLHPSSRGARVRFSGKSRSRAWHLRGRPVGYSRPPRRSMLGTGGPFCEGRIGCDTPWSG